MTPNPSDAEKKARRDAVERIRLLCELYVFYSTLLLPSTYVVDTWVRCLFWVACVSIHLSIYHVASDPNSNHYQFVFPTSVFVQICPLRFV